MPGKNPRNKIFVQLNNNIFNTKLKKYIFLSTMVIIIFEAFFTEKYMRAVIDTNYETPSICPIKKIIEPFAIPSS